MLNSTELYKTFLQTNENFYYNGTGFQLVVDLKPNITDTRNFIQTPHMIFLLKPFTDFITLPFVRCTIAAFLAILTLLALTGNALVMVVIRRRKSLCRNPAIIFIFNLAICELASCLLYRPMLIMDLMIPYTSHVLELNHRVHVCRAAMLLQTWFAGVGFHTIVAISQERLCLIVYPLKAKVWFSSGRSKKVLVVIWLLSAVIVCPIPILFAKLVVAEVNGTTLAYCGLFEFTKTGVVYFSALFILYFGLPSVILAVTYSKIFTTLYRRSSNLALASENKGNFKQMRTRRSLAKMLLTVAILFSTCWGPNFAFFLHIAMGGKVPSNGFFLVTLFEILPLISSTINPILYTVNSRTFRTSFKDLFCCHERHKLRAEDSVLRTFNGHRGENSWMPSPFATRSRSTSHSSGARFGSCHLVTKFGGHHDYNNSPSKETFINGVGHRNSPKRSALRQTSVEESFVYDYSPPKTGNYFHDNAIRMENIGEVSENDNHQGN